jgi:SAM-dependent methyltransferase
MSQELALNSYNSLRYVGVNRWDPNHLRTVDRLMPLRPGQRALEIGCGAGHLSRRLAARGVDVVGIDINPNAVAFDISDRIREMSAEDLHFPDDEFDAIFSFHTIEHLKRLEVAAAEAARVLKPGGRALFVYPAEPIRGLYAVPASIILHGTPFRAREIHCQWLTPGRVRALFEPLGLRETHHEFHIFKTPEFATTLVKV